VLITVKLAQHVCVNLWSHRSKDTDIWFLCLCSDGSRFTPFADFSVSLLL